MNNLSEALKNFSAKKITIVGDVMLDKTIFGEVSRISPEAPVPILKVEREDYELGGAANVAANVSSLGGNTSLFGFVGKDKYSKILLSLLKERKIKPFLDKNGSTTLKVRIKSRNQQIVRMDYETNLLNEFSPEILQKMQKEIRDSEIILISDYAKGTITHNLMEFLKSQGKRIVADPKSKNINFYSDVYLITPNEKEALEMSGQKDVENAGRYLRRKLDCNVLITRGERGMFLFAEKEIEIPTYAQEVYDIVGAGDTSIATLSLSLAAGVSLEESVIIANHAAGIAVSKAGTSSVRLNELERKLFGGEEKLKYFDELSKIISDLKKKGKRMVWTSGCFDLLHTGHIRYLKEAREKGDYLVVGLNSDSSVRKLKGQSRPINPEKERAEVIFSLPWVDYVMIYQEPTSTKYLLKFQPEVYVKGRDYTLETLDQGERKAVEDGGGRIELINVEKNNSTTKIIEKIKGQVL
jgi:D-beta-D-heptose 7-phosphate kinase/D-beta-D-heptose 1-phosphate adenosyltransferase